MSKKLVALQNADGSHSRWVGDRELQSMLDKGEVTRISARRDATRAYRMRLNPVEPSTSPNSTAALTASDARLLAELRKHPEGHVALDRLERLAGWGLIPVPNISGVLEISSKDGV